MGVEAVLILWTWLLTSAVDIPFEPNPTTLRPAFASALLLIPLAASAVNPTLQPISTRFAQTQSDISIELIASTFTDLDLEEEDDFDGWTACVEIKGASQVAYLLVFSQFE